MRMKNKWYQLLLLGAFILLSTRVSAEAIKVASWNIEWLTTSPSSSITASQRTAQDFHLLNQKFRQIAPDILAFQEVDSKAAIEQVVGSGYQIYLSDRSLTPHKQFNDLNQYTGFAISSDWHVSDPQDIELLPNSKLRFASYLIVRKSTGPDIHLLAVHLKQGCTAAKKRSRSCRQLAQQAQQLNQWMQQRLSRQQAFIVLGDFNHNLAYPGDWLWQQLQHGIEYQLELATRTTKARCQVQSNRDPKRLYRYPNLIDHIIVSKPSLSRDTKQILFTQEEALHHHLSDHCPVVSQIEFRKSSK